MQQSNSYLLTRKGRAPSEICINTIWCLSILANNLSKSMPLVDFYTVSLIQRVPSHGSHYPWSAMAQKYVLENYRNNNSYVLNYMPCLVG